MPDFEVPKNPGGRPLEAWQKPGAQPEHMIDEEGKVVKKEDEKK